MPQQIVNLPTMTTTTSAAGSNTNIISGLDDASAITLYISSSANFASTGTLALGLYVSQIDFSYPNPLSGVTQSTGFVPYTILSSLAGSHAPLLTSGTAVTISPVGFRSFRLSNLTSPTVGEPIAWATKTISV
jgi:hypothetical protein